MGGVGSIDSTGGKRDDRIALRRYGIKITRVGWFAPRN